MGLRKKYIYLFWLMISKSDDFEMCLNIYGVHYFVHVYVCFRLVMFFHYYYYYFFLRMRQGMNEIRSREPELHGQSSSARCALVEAL